MTGQLKFHSILIPRIAGTDIGTGTGGVVPVTGTKTMIPTGTGTGGVVPVPVTGTGTYP